MMEDQEYLDYMEWLRSLDRQYAPDAPESIEEAKWLEDRMKEVISYVK